MNAEEGWNSHFFNAYVTDKDPENEAQTTFLPHNVCSKWPLFGLMWPTLIFELADVQMARGWNLLPAVLKTFSLSAHTGTIPYTCRCIWFNRNPNIILILTLIRSPKPKSQPTTWPLHLQRGVFSGVKLVDHVREIFWKWMLARIIGRSIGRIMMMI